MKCRFCKEELNHKFIDLINSPPSNAFLSEAQLNQSESFFPLSLFVCERCWLVQIDEYKNAEEIFSSEYAYFSSYSTSWLEHAKQYVEMISSKMSLNPQSLVVEIASNDGYLLQYVQNRGIPCLGIEPARSTAKMAQEKGIEVRTEFFSEKLAVELVSQGQQADLLLGNNVLAHVPDINDFVVGLKRMLKPKGILTMEFPHLMRLVEQNQFDTIYHEHFSYFSFFTVQRIFSAHGLTLFDVDLIPTHGGSLRIYAKHADCDAWPVSGRVQELLTKEENNGLRELEYYKGFQAKVDQIKNDLIGFLIEQKRQDKTVVGYGAAAKGNTFLNYAGIKKDLLPFVVDASSHKQGKYLPGVHIPVVSEEKIKQLMPHYILILPWNLKSEILQQLNYIRKWNGRFVVAVPQLEIFQMRVLVTGSTGFIGNYVVSELLKTSCDVIVTSRNSAKASGYRWYPKVAHIPCDIYESKGRNFYSYFKEPEILIHLAWKGLPNYKNLFHFEENLFSEYTFLKSMVLGGVKQILITGTCFEYGMREGLLNEQMVANPTTPYGIAKDSLRRFLEQLNREVPFIMAWVRLFYLYGLGQNKSSLLSQLNQAIKNGDERFNMSGGEQLRDYLPVEKVAKYLVKVALQKKVSGTINCCSGKPVSIRNLVESVLKENHQKMSLNLGYYPYPDFEPMAFWGDNRKMREIIDEQ